MLCSSCRRALPVISHVRPTSGARLSAGAKFQQSKLSHQAWRPCSFSTTAYAPQKTATLQEQKTRAASEATTTAAANDVPIRKAAKRRQKSTRKREAALKQQPSNASPKQSADGECKNDAPSRALGGTGPRAMKAIRRKTRQGIEVVPPASRSPRTTQTPAPEAKTDPEVWQKQKAALDKKFEEGYAPRKRLSPDALPGIRMLHASDPVTFSTPVLAEHFKVSPESIRRILKSKWQPSSDEEEERRLRWDRRGERIWSKLAELGTRPPKKWRSMGVGRVDWRAGEVPAWRKKRQQVQVEDVPFVDEDLIEDLPAPKPRFSHRIL